MRQDCNHEIDVEKKVKFTTTKNEGVVEFILPLCLLVLAFRPIYHCRKAYVLTGYRAKNAVITTQVVI